MIIYLDSEKCLIKHEHLLVGRMVYVNILGKGRHFLNSVISIYFLHKYYWASTVCESSLKVAGIIEGNKNKFLLS